MNTNIISNESVLVSESVVTKKTTKKDRTPPTLPEVVALREQLVGESDYAYAKHLDCVSKYKKQKSAYDRFHSLTNNSDNMTLTMFVNSELCKKFKDKVKSEYGYGNVSVVGTELIKLYVDDKMLVDSKMSDLEMKLEESKIKAKERTKEMMELKKTIGIFEEYAVVNNKTFDDYLSSIKQQIQNFKTNRQ